MHLLTCSHSPHGSMPSPSFIDGNSDCQSQSITKDVNCDRIMSKSIFYHIAGYFHGVLIFVIFVVQPDVTKFSTHEIFRTQCSAVYMCSNLDQQRFVFATCASLTMSLIHKSQAVPRVMAEEVNSVEKQMHNKQKQGQYLSSNVEEPKVAT